MLTCIDLWHGLVDCDVPRTETDKKLTEFWINLYKQESSRRREQKLNLNHKIWVTAPRWTRRLEPVYKLRTREWRGGRIPLRKTPSCYKHFEQGFKMATATLGSSWIPSKGKDGSYGVGSSDWFWQQGEIRLLLHVEIRKSESGI